MARKRIRLRIVKKPETDQILSAPPELETDDHTVDYLCGHCGVVLILAGETLSDALTIRCTVCRSHNVTDDC
jgi:predicted RNA-binding Zn-ribbon protein involved in translation (DUF1610 family)